MKYDRIAFFIILQGFRLFRSNSMQTVRVTVRKRGRISSAGDPVPKRRGASGGSRVPPSGSGVGNGHRVRGEPRDEVLPLYGVFVPPLPELVGKSL